ncbi:MAG: hypothetical protein IJ760_06110 [Bacteroidales bacterium]|nr:hypothetical protein [Bacteroidales bacterium]
MRKFVIHTALFLAVAAAAVTLLTWLLGGTGLLANVTYRLGHQDFTYSRSHEADTAGPVDVLFAGSSHCYRSFDPRIFAAEGLRCFNLGSSNQTPQQTEALLHRYLRRLEPRLVVIEVHPDIIEYDGVEATLGWLCNAPPSAHNLPLLLRQPNARTFCTAIYATLHNATSAEYRNYSDPPEDVHGNRYVAGGYVERDTERWQPQTFASDTIRPLPMQLRALRRTVGYLRRKGVDYMLVTTPDTRALTESLTNLAAFDSLMATFGPHHRLDGDCLDDTLHFYDEGHLNQEGVAIIDKQMTALINEHLGTDVGDVARRRRPGAVQH